MKFLKNIFFASLLLIVLLTAGCLKQEAYEPKRLSAPLGMIQEKNNIIVTKNVLTDNECKKIFGGRRLLARGYQPVQIYIKNNNPEPLMLDPNYITLALENPKAVAYSMHRNLAAKTMWFLRNTENAEYAKVKAKVSESINKDIDFDIEEKSLNINTKTIIRPYGILNKVVFILTENYQSSFNLSLFDKNNDKVTFNL